MAIFKEDIVDINLETGRIHRTFLMHSIGKSDSAADRFGVRLFRDGQPVDISSGVTVQGFFRDPQGNNIAITSGNLVYDNVAEVVLPQACYNYEGQFCQAIKLVDSTNSITGTYRIVDGIVDNTNTGGAVAPTGTVPTYQEVLSVYGDMVDALEDAAGWMTNFAPAFALGTANAAGSYVTYDGNVYLLPAGHEANVTWANTTKTKVNVGGELSGLKSAMSSEDAVVNDALSYVDYGYETPYYKAEASSGSWNDKIGVKRDGQIVILNKQTKKVNATVNIRLNGSVSLAGNTAGIAAWTSGLTLKTGHEYCMRMKLIGGSSLNGETSEPPALGIYEAGNSSIIGTLDLPYPDTRTRTFTAESGKTYNIAIRIPDNTYVFTNAKLMVVLEDLTESKFVDLQSQIDEIKTDTEYYDQTLISGNITGTGAAGNSNEYIRTRGGYLPQIEKGDIIVAGNGFAIVNVHIYSSSKLTSKTHIANLTVTDANRFEIPDDYIGKYVGVTVNEPSKSGQDISGDVADAIANVKLAKVTSVSDEISDLKMRVDALETGINLPDYYFDDDYIDDKAEAINTIGIGLSRQSLQTVFITDCHWEENAKVSPDMIKYLADRTGIRNVVFGGDAINHANSQLGGLSLLFDFLNDFRKTEEKANVYYITGNHEMNDPDTQSPDNRLPQEVPYRLFNEPIQNKIVCLEGTNTFYVDDNAARIRFYGIDCNYGSSIMLEARVKVMDSLLTVPEGYAVLFFSHTGTTKSDGVVTGVYDRLAQIMDCAIAMNDGEPVDITIGAHTYSYDFTGKARTFIGAITGHVHIDGYYIYRDRFPVIATICDTGAYKSTHTWRIAGTTSEQAFDVVQIDVENEMIYCTRIGYGDDRVFRFGVGAGPVTE